MNQNYSFAPFGNYQADGGALIPGLLIMALLGLVGFLLVVRAYRRYIGSTLAQSMALWGLATVSATACLFHIIMTDRNGGTKPLVQICFFTDLLFFLAVPFVVRLYRKWIGGQLTKEEKLPGMDGVRAWLGTGNVLCASLIPVCAWQLFSVSLPIMFALTYGLLLMYPIFNVAAASPQPAAAVPTEDLSSEREKVLQMLESGKITAEESAELLNALGQTIPPRPEPFSEQPLSPQRKIVLLGAVLLLAGFFLPWFSINPAALANEMSSQFQQNVNQMMPGVTMPQVQFPMPGGTVQVHGGDIPHGLGWWILVLGVGVAALPFFATNLKVQMQRKVVLVALGIGAFLLVYLLSDTFRYMSIGIVLALAGYVLEFAGTLKERFVAR